MTRAARWPWLLVWLGAVAGAAAFGAQFEPGAWYAALEKPPGTPPPWVFAPAWTLLYLLMAIAAWRVHKADAYLKAEALFLFSVQLVLNALWSWIFFGLHRQGLALVEILLLAATIALTRVFFRRIDGWASLLLLPYQLWVLYAAWLNAGLWWLHRGG